MPEFEPKPQPEIVVPTLDDVESYRRMQARGWRDTYPNEAAGVSTEWVEQVTSSWLTPEALADSRERVANILGHPDNFLYVAKVDDDCIGMVHATHIDGKQRLEALYVDKLYQGTGIAYALMDAALQQLDLAASIELEVIAYNERAQRFYEKYGFSVVPGSEHLYKDVMPSLKMVRPGGAEK